MKYYILNLKHNRCSNPNKIRNVRLVRSIPELDIEDEYEGLEIIAYESGKFFGSYMIDGITGKKVFFDDGTISKELKYKSKSLLSDEQYVRIKEVYDNLTPEEIERYKDGINQIEKDTISEYNRLITIPNNIIHEFATK